MRVEINDTSVVVPDGCTNLGQLLEHENLAAPGLAVATGSHVIQRAEWDNTALTEDMKITVIRAVCGG